MTIERRDGGGWRITVPVRREEVAVEKRTIVYEEWKSGGKCWRTPRFWSGRRDDRGRSRGAGFPHPNPLPLRRARGSIR